MNLIETAAREYERKKRDLDVVIEKKKSEMSILNERIIKLEEDIKLNEKKIKSQEEEIEILHKFAEKNVENYTRDLEKIKLNLENKKNKEVDTPVIIHHKVTSRRSRERHDVHS